MNSRSPSLVELHWEKVLLGAAAALALYVAWSHLLKSPNTVAYQGRSMRPSELHEAILQEALLLEHSMRDAEMPPAAVPRYHQQLRELHMAGILGGDAELSVCLLPWKLRRTAMFGKPFHVPISLHAPVRLVTPLPPTRPEVETGRCLLAEEASDTQQAEQGSADGREIGWVRIAARFAIKQQREAMLAAGYPSYAAAIYVVGVAAQRQQLLADGSFSEWQDVPPCVTPPPPQVPAPLFDEHTGKLLNRDALDEVFAQVKASQPLLVRPPFREVIAGDRPPAVVEQPADVEGGNEKESMAIWVHDTHAEASTSYRYRVRTRLWNRLVGRTRAVRDAADAERAVLTGAWSAPSEVITAAPRHHFFLLGRSVDGSGANVEVWTWHRGRWLRKSFAVAVGDVIGGVAKVKTGDVDEQGRPIRERIDFSTGLVVLDIRKESRVTRARSRESGRFDQVEQPTLVVVCLDPADGRVTERFQVADRVDPMRKRLRQDAVRTSSQLADNNKTDIPRPPRPRP